MGRLVDLTSKTVARIESTGRLPLSSSAGARLALIRTLVDLGLVVFSAEGFRRFVATPYPVFGGRTALQLIEQGEGVRVLELLAATYEGAAA